MPNPRADYSPIFDRPALHHPEHARVLVWPVANLEVWDPTAAMPRTVLPAPQGREVVPDVANFGRFDYGFDTPDILAEEGVEYVCDWCNDDQPYAMNVRSGELISVPYCPAPQHHHSSEILDRTKAQFDTLYSEGAESPRVMAISTHPYLTGAAHRINYFDQIFDYLKSFDDVAFVTAGEVLDWYRDATVGRDV